MTLAKTILALAFATLASPALRAQDLSGEAQDSDTLFWMPTADSLLREEARRNFLFITDQVENSYSRTLDSLRAQTAAHSLLFGNGRAIAVLDPLKVDIGLALGLSKEETIAELMKAQGLDSLSSTEMYQVTEHILQGEPLSGGGIGVWYKPKLQRAGDTDIIIPVTALAFGDIFEHAGIKETVAFFNTHESCHGLDTVYADAPLDGNELSSALMAGYWALAVNKPAQHALSTIYNCEAFADVAACGERIFNGSDTRLIDQIIQMRKDNYYDMEHMSVPTLRGMKDTLNDIGLDAFRRLSAPERFSVYYGVVARHGLPPDGIRLLAEYQAGNDSLRRAFERTAMFDPLLHRAIEVVKLTRQPDQAPRRPGLSKKQEKQLDEKTLFSEEGDILLARALKDDGKWTPLTVARAFAALQNDYTEALWSAKSKTDRAEMMSRIANLREDFFRKMQDMRFTGESAENGINLFQTEPALKKLLRPDAPPPPLPKLGK